MNLLAPSPDVMLSTLAALVVVAGVFAYAVVRVVRAARRGTAASGERADHTDHSRDELVLRLESDVAELREAQRFTEALLESRTANTAPRSANRSVTDPIEPADNA